jgi:hypothetical protein
MPLLTFCVLSFRPTHCPCSFVCRRLSVLFLISLLVASLSDWIIMRVWSNGEKYQSSCVKNVSSEHMCNYCRGKILNNLIILGLLSIIIIICWLSISFADHDIDEDTYIYIHACTFTSYENILGTSTNWANRSQYWWITTNVSLSMVYVSYH